MASHLHSSLENEKHLLSETRDVLCVITKDNDVQPFMTEECVHLKRL